MDVSAFVSQNTGKFVKSPHGITGQCVSVPSQFAVDNGWPELFGAGDDTALHIWENGIAGYQKVINESGNFPVPGDFVFFSYNHVVLVTAANVNDIFAFEQNDPIGSSAHQKTYNYPSVIGWFHHPSATPPPASGGTATVNKSLANVRALPNSTATITSQLREGDTFKYTQKVVGESVSGNNVWYHSTEGHYVWSGGITG